MLTYLKGIAIGVLAACSLAQGQETPVALSRDGNPKDVKEETTANSQGAWALISDFQSDASKTRDGKDGWRDGTGKAGKRLFEVVANQIDNSNKVLCCTISPEAASAGQGSLTRSGTVNILPGRTGTVFMRMMVEKAFPEEKGHNLLLTVTAGPAKAGVRIGGRESLVVQGLGGGEQAPMKSGVWYRLWIVVDNKASGDASGTILIQEDSPGSQPLVSAGKSMSAMSVDYGTFTSFYLQGYSPATVWLDDLYVDNSGGNADVPIEAAKQTPSQSLQSQGISMPLKADPRLQTARETRPIDALGKTGWFQGMWPSDPSMPNLKFPRFVISPEQKSSVGFAIGAEFPMDQHLNAFMPKVSLSLVGSDDQKLDLYTGGAESQIAYRFGNLLKLVDNSGPVNRSVELAIISFNQAVARVRLAGNGNYKLEARASVDAGNSAEAKDGRGLIQTPQGWHGFELLPGSSGGEALVLSFWGAPSRNDALTELAKLREMAADFNGLWQRLAKPQALEPFLAGDEKDEERNLVAAFVNRVLRNQRRGGLIKEPVSLEFFGPEWSNADMVWMWFQPASRYSLWIEPQFLKYSLEGLLDRQRTDGFTPQMAGTGHSSGTTQNPNISTVALDYYRFTGDRAFLAACYPKFKNMYWWFLKNRAPDANAILTLGHESMPLSSNIYEYGRDNHPTAHGIIPAMRDVEGVENRQERLYLPDIVACQARLADDIAFMAETLGDKEEAVYFAGEFRLVKDWANATLWDEETKFYYPVVRATGKKVMRRLNMGLWMLWAGIPDQKQKDALVSAIFDPQQFFTKIPLPQLALNDPAFNPKISHWGDGYVWPIDVFHVFDGLLRYGEYEKAAMLAQQFNRGVYATIADTYQPNEIYHHTGKAVGCPIMGTAGCLPLVFQRYLKNYKDGKVSTEWAKLTPALK